MTQPGFDLRAAAHQEMLAEGFQPDFSPAVNQQVKALEGQKDPVTADGVRDLRSMLWSSIDNDSSRDLDQAEVAERVSGGIRVMVAIADVDADVPVDSPIDRHAAYETTSVYTGVETFPMLPEELSTGLTSLNENVDRRGGGGGDGSGCRWVDLVSRCLSGAGAQSGAVDLQRRRAVAGGDRRSAAESSRVLRSGSATEAAG